MPRRFYTRHPVALAFLIAGLALTFLSFFVVFANGSVLGFVGVIVAVVTVVYAWEVLTRR